MVYIRIGGGVRRGGDGNDFERPPTAGSRRDVLWKCLPEFYSSIAQIVSGFFVGRFCGRPEVSRHLFFFNWCLRRSISQQNISFITVHL